TELQSAAALFLGRNNVYRNMSRNLVMFQAVQHRPPFHVGQLDVEGDSVGTIALRELQRRLAPRGDDALEAFAVRDVEEDARVGDVVLDDEENAVPLGDFFAVV